MAIRACRIGLSLARRSSNGRQSLSRCAKTATLTTSGRAARIRMLEKMLDVVTKTPNVWITTVGEVAAHHAASVHAGRYVVQPPTPAPIAARRFKGPS